jgi:hypothetical protein
VLKTQLLSAKQIGKNLERLVSEHREFRWAVAWGTSGEHADHLLAHKAKIKNLLIGIDFYQTDPDLLRRLLNHPRCRVALDICSGTFHPKVFHFQSGPMASAIVGSANFTASGIDRNEEMAVLFEGKSEDPLLRGLRTQIETLWLRGAEIKKPFLDSYSIAHATAKQHRDALRKTRLVKPRANATHPDLLRMPWGQYLRAARKTDRFEERMEVLAAAAILFASENTFQELGNLERKAIAGFIGKKEIALADKKWNTLDWGWFGAMGSAGSFKRLINRNSPHISDAMNEIPLVGDVSETQYKAFAAKFERAFAREQRKEGIATASRLLAMKRPDYFVCIDSANRQGLGDDLGFAPTTLGLEKYWESVIIPLMQARWWRESRPIERADARVWDRRTAMVDTLYYVPHG